MDGLFYQRSLQAGEQERLLCSGNTWCGACLKEDGCSWCNGNSQSSGSCQVLGDPTTTCSEAVTTSGSQCPSVGADVVLRNVSGLLGAMVAVAVILNVVNRFSNKRRNAKLRKSIFTLPVYVYPSREKKAAAVRMARELLHSPTASGMKDIEEAEAESTDDEGYESNAEVTCTICLSTYEEKEVIKVLPCGHDFHSGCLDSWLACKATCPLCKTPAFAKNRDTPRRGSAASPVHASTPPPRPAGSRPFSYRSSRAVLISPDSPDQPRDSDSGGGGLEVDMDSVELLALAITSQRSMLTRGNIYPRSEAVQAVNEVVVAGGGSAPLEGVGEGCLAETELVRGEKKSDDESKMTCGSDGGSDAGSGGGSNGGSDDGDVGSDSVPADNAGFAAANDTASASGDVIADGIADGRDAADGVGAGRHAQAEGRYLQGVDVGPSATPVLAATTVTSGDGWRSPPLASSATATPVDGWRSPLLASSGGADDVYLYDVEAGQPASAQAVAGADGHEANSRADGAEESLSPAVDRFVAVEV